MIRTTIFSIEIPSFKVALFGTKRSHISSSYPPFTALKFSSCIEIVSTTRVLPLQVFSRGEKNPTSRKVCLRRVKKSWTKAHIYLYIYISTHFLIFDGEIIILRRDGVIINYILPGEDSCS